MSDERLHAPDEADEVERLLRLAGRRTEVQIERSARVRAAAEAEWRRTVEVRARKRFGWVAAGLAAAAVLTLLVSLRSTEVAPPVVTAELVGGSLWVDGVALAPGASVPMASSITTDGSVPAALRLGSGHSLRLDRATTVRLVGERDLALDRGAVYVDSGGPSASPSGLIVQTPLGRVRELGTQYEVRLAGDELRLRLREGAALLTAATGEHRVEAGGELRVGIDGAVRRAAVRRHGDAWEWLAEVTPMPELQGLKLSRFISWAARERGWTVRFADPELERSAAATELGGTVRSLSLDEALAAVLASARMAYRVDGGVLEIVAAADSIPSALARVCSAIAAIPTSR